jgi:hypothetical protein
MKDIEITNTDSIIAIDFFYKEGFVATNTHTKEVHYIMKELVEEIATFDNVWLSEKAEEMIHAI